MLQLLEGKSNPDESVQPGPSSLKRKILPENTRVTNGSGMTWSWCGTSLSPRGLDPDIGEVTPGLPRDGLGSGLHSTEQFQMTTRSRDLHLSRVRDV